MPAGIGPGYGSPFVLLAGIGPRHWFSRPAGIGPGHWFSWPAGNGPGHWFSKPAGNGPGHGHYGLGPLGAAPDLLIILGSLGLVPGSSSYVENRSLLDFVV